MNDIYYYLILGVLLYFLFTYILERFSNLEQENFDPSLVPVSSIVTLAKVAQKLVNGNGTLTNPGNLQIGIGNGGATGNLKVTGSSTFGSTIDGPNTFNVSGTAGVSGDTAIGGKLNVTGDTTVNSTINIAAGSEEKGIKITSGNPHISFTKTGSTAVPQIYSDGTILHAYNAPFQVDQNLTVKGKTTIGNATDSPNTLNVVGTVGVSGDTALGGALTVNGISTGGELAAKNYTTNSSYKFIPGGSTFSGGVNANALNLYAYGTNGIKHVVDFNDNGNAEFFGNLTTNKLTAGPITWDDFLQMKLMLKILRYNTPVRFATLCTKATPIVLIDGFISTWDAAAWPFATGKYPNLTTAYQYSSNYGMAGLRETATVNDRIDMLLIYPGFGFKGWSNVNYANDNTNDPLPQTFENRTKEIMYYHFKNGRESTSANINNYGIDLHNWSDPANPPERVNLQNTLSSFEAYELLP